MTEQRPSIPTATYRLQFNSAFGFADASGLLPYLQELGISHIYASPLTMAAPGSTHGYDVRDHNKINPELGSAEELLNYAQALQGHGMEQILDFVPNHMGVNEGCNPYWQDVLEHGMASGYADFFDIDWRPVKRELENKVLLPVLGDQYGRVLERGELGLAFGDNGFSVEYYGIRFPIGIDTALPLLYFALNRLTLPEVHEDRLELHSIITAAKNLPPTSSTDGPARAERTRESRIVKKRLAVLCRKSPMVNEAVQAAVAKWQVSAGDPASGEPLHQLLEAQSYRLSYWRVAGEEINYRRFFDISNLAALRMESLDVFETTHRMLSELLRDGFVTGVRLDHIDGLSDPRTYCERLQRRYAALFGLPPEGKPLYLLVEKILTGNEVLQKDWPIHGTTGYDFANQVLAVLLDVRSEAFLTETFARFTGQADSWQEIVYRSKQHIADVSMAAEVNMLGHMLDRIVESSRHYRDFTLNALTEAIREVAACFPAYRSYIIPPEAPREEDRRMVERAISAARKRNPMIDSSIFEFLRNVIFLPAEDKRGSVDETARAAFVLKFQQVTGPLTAKGIEDTASYIYNRLVALNEVGGDPDVFGGSLERFHRQNAVRLADFPHAMISTSTHDTKRSEDVRARIAAISERPRLWRRAVQKWSIATRKFKTKVDDAQAPDANEEYLFYQTILGSWPLESPNGRVERDYIQRVQEYMIKALREAKRNTSWIEPREAWEQAVRQYVEAVLGDDRFIATFLPVAAEFSKLGAINALSQTLLKLTVPGVPDIYRGTELWDFSLADPDNRRPVDFAVRQELLASLRGPVEPRQLLHHWHDGRIKLFLTSRMLAFRREHPSLFMDGRYEPLQVSGRFSENLITFERIHPEARIAVVAPRLTKQIGWPPIGQRWEDTAIQWRGPGPWKDLFTGHGQKLGESVFVSDVLRELPFAVLWQSK